MSTALTNEQITNNVREMEERLHACAASGQAYRVKWHDVKLIIAMIKILQGRLDQANDFNNDVVEREAACCPEDVGFDEYIRSLQSQLEQLRAELAEEKRLRVELKQIAQTGIGEVSSVGTALKEIAVTDLRISVVELCKQRASEYDQYARGYEPSDRVRLCLSAKRDALKAFATELEKL